MLDLLLENPIFIGVIIYFIWMFFKPSKADKKSPPNRPTSPGQESTPTYYEPKLDKKVEPKVEKKTLPTSSQEHESHRKVTLTQSNSNESAQFDYAKEKRRLEERKKQAEAVLNKLNSNSPVMVQKEEKHISSLYSRRVTQPTKEQLREGVIWAEILSKPKARRSSIK